MIDGLTIADRHMKMERYSAISYPTFSSLQMPKSERLEHT